MRMVPPRDRAPCDTPSSTRPLACGCCRLAAFDAITRQQRPALERARSPPPVAGGMLPTSQGLGILLHPGGPNVHSQFRHRRPGTLLVLAALGVGCSASAARAGHYTPCDTTMGGQTITLNGHDLSIEQVMSVARHGAQVRLSAPPRQRQSGDYA